MRPRIWRKAGPASSRSPLSTLSESDTTPCLAEAIRSRSSGNQAKEGSKSLRDPEQQHCGPARARPSIRESRICRKYVSVPCALLLTSHPVSSRTFPEHCSQTLSSRSLEPGAQREDAAEHDQHQQARPGYTQQETATLDKDWHDRVEWLRGHNRE